MAQPRLHSSPSSARNSPRGRRTEDSPSRQLHWDIERALSQIHLHEIEKSKLHAYQKRQQQEDLDAQEAAQAHVHRLELSTANAQYEVVRKQAEAVLQAHIKEEEEERRRREEEARQRLEAEERRRKAEEEARRRAEEQRKVEEENEHRQREQRDRQEAKRQAKEKADLEEKARKEKAASEQKQQQETAKAEEEAILKQQQRAKAAKAAPISPSATGRSAVSQVQSPDIEERHKEYLALHQKLKTFRREFWTTAKKDSALKTHVGDMRRAMRTSVGQLTEDKLGNKKAVSTPARTRCADKCSRLMLIAARSNQNNLATSPEGPSITPCACQRLLACSSQPRRQWHYHYPIISHLPSLHLQQGYHRCIPWRMRCQPESSRAHWYARCTNLLDT